MFVGVITRRPKANVQLWPELTQQAFSLNVPAHEFAFVIPIWLCRFQCFSPLLLCHLTIQHTGSVATLYFLV